MEQIYTQTAWSLSDLFPAHESPEMQAAFKSVEEKVAEFEQSRNKLSPEIKNEDFLQLIEQQETVYRQFYRIYSYSGLWFSGNTQDQTAQNFMARVDQFMANVQNRMLFFSLWWKSLDDQQAGRLVENAGKYRYWLEEMRLFKPYTLSEAEEKIINLKDVTGARALTTLYDTITNRYVFQLEVDGEVKEMTRGEISVFSRHHDPDLRAKAYQELFRVYVADQSILGQIYQTLVRDWTNENINLRGFYSPIAARNLTNAIPDDVVDTLLEVCQKNAGLFQRFFRLKARMLGVDRLRRYDIYAPLAKSDRKYDFSTATEMVLDSFRSFDPQVEELARRVFEQGHLDSEVRKGKRSGAFCWSVSPDLTPWVLLNYQGRSEDVATMAHELGHAIHSLLASHHTMFTFHATLPLAETASTFGEMILVDRLLAEEQDENVRRDLIFRQVDDAYATIMRQAFFALFERQAHKMIQDGASVSELSDAYLQNLKDQFGDSVQISDEFQWEWISIPHIFHTPFYVYAYAFGQLLVLSLYQQYQAEGESFKPRYLKILRAGGSAAPESVLTDAGIDIHQAEFWQGGFNVLAGLIDQLEKLSD